MNSLKYTIFLPILLLSQFLGAQNVGYQGKKLSIGVEVSGMPLVGYLMTTDKLFDFNIKGAGILEYAVSKKIAVGLKFGIQEDLTAIPKLDDTKLTPLQIFNFGAENERIESKNSIANYSVKYVGTSLKIFNQNFGSIAPVGQYFKFGYEAALLTIYDDGRYYNKNQLLIHSKLYHSYIIGAGIQNVFFDHLIADISFNVGLNYDGARAMTATLNNQRFYHFHAATKKVFADNFLRAQFKLSWLLF